MKDAWKFLGGSAAVYAVMAACSTSKLDLPDDPVARAGRTGNATAGSGGASAGDAPTGGQTANGGMMGMAGEPDVGAGGSSAGTGPRDAGMMDALADAMMDPVPDAAAEPVSGSRLKRRYYVGDDGSREPLYGYGWYDTERQENCIFTTAADGATRCVPQTAGGASGFYFADSNCTQEVALVTTTCGAPLPKYIFKSTPQSGCAGGTSSIHLIGPQQNLTMYYLKSGETCLGVAVTAGQAFYTIGAEVPASSFVRAVEERDE